jgi:phosphoribosyl-dephospho-CoA transferase
VEVTAQTRHRVHDLILFAAGSDKALPPWAFCEDGLAWAVVRRELSPDEDVIAAGVRGPQRTQRQAIKVDEARILRTATPDELAANQLVAQANPGICLALEVLAVEAASWFRQRSWGPTGSVGFQLATGLPVVTDASDLDIIIRTNAYMGPLEAQFILERLASLPCHIDCLLETGVGAIALAEWAAATGNQVMVRTPDGPSLKPNPWVR